MNHDAVIAGVVAIPPTAGLVIAATDFSGAALLVSAVGTLVTALGIAVVGIMTSRQKRKQEEQAQVLEQVAEQSNKQGAVLNKVEKQGNSVSLELKRTNMVYSRRLAQETRKKADVAIADDAQRVYEEAAKSDAADRASESGKPEEPAISMPNLPK